jgi:hypothetical protein
MEKILKKQLVELERLRKIASLELVEDALNDRKTDKHFVSLENSNKREASLEEKMVGSLARMEKTLEKGLMSDDPKSLNKNMTKLHERIKKQTEMFEKTIKMSPERAREVTEKSMGRDQFRTFGERIGEFKESFKNFFTLKGFVNKTGLVNENSEGILANYINKRDVRQKFIEDRMSMDFEGKKGQGQIVRQSMENANPRMEGESDKDYEKRLREKAKESFGRKFDEAQEIKKKQRENEKTIARLEERGFTREQISRRTDDPYAERIKLASKLAKVDTRYKEAAPPKESDKPKSKESAEIIPFPSKEDGQSSSVPISSESSIESIRLQERQAGLLEKIEQNTRAPGPALAEGEAKSAQTAPQESSSILDMIPGKGIVRGALDIGKKILGGVRTAGSGLARFAGTPMGMKLGGALAVSGGAYTAYKGWTGSEEEKQAELAKIDEALASGQIDEKEVESRKKALDEATVEKKSAAVGEGGGMAAGAIGGAKIGAALGSFAGPVGTGIGALAGAGLGAFAGSKAGQVAGEYAGKAINVGKEAVGNIGDKIKGFASSARDYFTSKPVAGASDPSSVIMSPEEAMTSMSQVQVPKDSSVIYTPSKQNVEIINSKDSVQNPIIVNAPTTNVANNRQNISIPVPIRNEEYSLREYSRSRLIY